jgi:predicted metal-dependent enzyme (double-stranded beta helix superfamily)
MLFDVEGFIQDCREAVAGSDPHRAVQALVERAVSNPSAMIAGLGEPQRAGVHKLHVSDELTVLNLVWGPHMTLLPHNHEMWAAIGSYTGREDNIFWRRIPGEDRGKLKAAGARALSSGEVAALGPDVIHSVTNPTTRLTGAIHVYGGNFFDTPRSEWDPETLLEEPYDVEKNVRLFEESNRRLETR